LTVIQKSAEKIVKDLAFCQLIKSTDFYTTHDRFLVDDYIGKKMAILSIVWYPFNKGSETILHISVQTHTHAYMLSTDHYHALHKFTIFKLSVFVLQHPLHLSRKQCKLVNC